MLHNSDEHFNKHLKVYSEKKPPSTEKLRADFEYWYFAQFNNGIGLNFTDEGYENETVNALWIGFCAGRLTA